MKRQRGRGRKPGGGGGGGGHHQGNRPFESNGPDVKIRGTAAQIYEKYAQYARDAQSSGDRVKYESYLQHAEHYFRIMAATMPREQRIAQTGENGMQGPMGIGAPGEERDNEEVSADPMKVVDEQSDDEGDEAEGDEAEGGEDSEEAQASGGGNQDERGEGQGDRQGRRRRRGRRRNHEGQGGGDHGGGGGGGGETRGERQDGEARSALDSLARKQGALAGG